MVAQKQIDCLDSAHSATMGGAQAVPAKNVCERMTCPDEVADVVRNKDSAGGSMARAETLAAINVACGADSINCHTKHGGPTLPVSIGLALLEEVGPQSPRRHLGCFSEACHRGKGTDGVQ